MHFPEIAKLKFGKKMPYIVLYFKAFFSELWLLMIIISEKCMVAHIFHSGFQ